MCKPWQYLLMIPNIYRVNWQTNNRCLILDKCYWWTTTRCINLYFVNWKTINRCVSLYKVHLWSLTSSVNLDSVYWLTTNRCVILYGVYWLTPNRCVNLDSVNQWTDKSCGLFIGGFLFSSLLYNRKNKNTPSPHPCTTIIIRYPSPLTLSDTISFHLYFPTPIMTQKH